MFPATKKYPRPTLPLLRKRNKQRSSQRPKTQASRCRLKATSNGHLKASGFGSVGEANPGFLTNRINNPPPTRRATPAPPACVGDLQGSRQTSDSQLPVKSPFRLADARRLPPLTTFGLVTGISITSQHNPQPHTPQKSDTVTGQIYIFPGVGASAYPRLSRGGAGYVSDITNIMGGRFPVW